MLYLAPEPDDGFRRLTEAVVQEWPEAPPYGGAYDDNIPHLTVAHDLGDEQLDEIDQVVTVRCPSDPSDQRQPVRLRQRAVARPRRPAVRLTASDPSRNLGWLSDATWAVPTDEGDRSPDLRSRTSANDLGGHDVSHPPNSNVSHHATVRPAHRRLRDCFWSRPLSLREAGSLRSPGVHRQHRTHNGPRHPRRVELGISTRQSWLIAVAAVAIGIALTEVSTRDQPSGRARAGRGGLISLRDRGVGAGPMEQHAPSVASAFGTRQLETPNMHLGAAVN